MLRVGLAKQSLKRLHPAAPGFGCGRNKIYVYGNVEPDAWRLAILVYSSCEFAVVVVVGGDAMIDDVMMFGLFFLS